MTGDLCVYPGPLVNSPTSNLMTHLGKMLKVDSLESTISDIPTCIRINKYFLAFIIIIYIYKYIDRFICEVKQTHKHIYIYIY